jgi:phosphoribulokinase
MSRRNTVVVPGGKMGMAMEIILMPILEQLMRNRDNLRRRQRRKPVPPQTP